ncbi:hypothetical protein BsWGS_14156 [Bradybaena similaris]
MYLNFMYGMNPGFVLNYRLLKYHKDNVMAHTTIVLDVTTPLSYFSHERLKNLWCIHGNEKADKLVETQVDTSDHHNITEDGVMIVQKDVASTEPSHQKDDG